MSGSTAVEIGRYFPISTVAATSMGGLLAVGAFCMDNGAFCILPYATERID